MAYAIWPVLMGISIVILFSTDSTFCFAGFLIFGIAAGQFLIIIFLEHVSPIDPDWSLLGDPQKFSHIGHAATSEMGSAAGAGAAVYFSQLVANGFGWGLELWPNSWPILAQICIGLLIHEFFAYWLHRAFHEAPALWPIHAIHHSIERMNVLVTGRTHLFSAFVSRSILLAPLYLAGATDEVFAAVAAVTLWSANLAHANIKMRFPAWILPIITTNLTHHLHHDRDIAVGNGNYGSVLLVYDRIFRTYIPSAAKSKVEIGVTNDPVPRKFLLELLAPVIWPYLVRQKNRIVRN